MGIAQVAGGEVGCWSFSGDFPDGGLDVLAARGQHSAVFARGVEHDRVDVSVRMQNFVTTASRCSTSITAISSTQLSSPVTFQAFTTSGVCSISLTTRAYSTRPTRTIARMP